MKAAVVSAQVAGGVRVTRVGAAVTKPIYPGVPIAATAAASAAEHAAELDARVPFVAAVRAVVAAARVAVAAAVRVVVAAVRPAVVFSPPAAVEQQFAVAAVFVPDYAVAVVAPVPVEFVVV